MDLSKSRKGGWIFREQPQPQLLPEEDVKNNKLEGERIIWIPMNKRKAPDFRRIGNYSHTSVFACRHCSSNEQIIIIEDRIRKVRAVKSA